MAPENNPAARLADVVIQELKGEVLIYDLKLNKAYCLNEPSAMVYQLCNGNNSVSDIGKQLSEKLKTHVSEDLVWLAVSQLKQDNLLDNSSELKTKFDGLSRRDVIRKVGLSTMIALPVISSLIAPTAAMAQSSGSPGPCSDSGAVVESYSDTCTNCRTELIAVCCNGIDQSTYNCDPTGGGGGDFTVRCFADCA